MSLRSRIVFAVAAVFAVISGLAVGLMLNQAETSLRTSFDRATLTRANWLVSLVSVDPVIVPLPTSREQMLLTYSSYGRRQTLFRSPDFPAGPQESGAALPSYRAVTVEPTGRYEGQFRLTLAVPDASLRQDSRRLRWAFGLGWLGSLLLAFGAGYGVAGWLLRPIQRIIDRANAITGAGAIGQIDMPATRDELYWLTEALNRMLARIGETIRIQQHFFGAAAHELRTPLAIMKTGIEVTLKARNDVDAPMAGFLTGQLDDVNRLARLLDEFLTLSRPEGQGQSIRFTVVDVSALVAECLTQLGPVAAEYGVSLSTGPTRENGYRLPTDRVKLEHVLLNLLENAIKYAVTGSVVTVTLDALPTRLTIRVGNKTKHPSGPTLDLMQPYFQADPLVEGHGLGLWISHQLTALLGGQLTLNWQGFVFTGQLTLPIHQSSIN